MAKFVLKDCWIAVSGVDLSDHVSSVEVNTSADDVATTAFSGSGGVERMQGLRDDSFTLNFHQDFDPSEVDATLWPLYDSGSAFTVEVAAHGSVVSGTNPKYSGTCIMTEYQPIAGEIGALSETSVTFPVSGKIARSTA